MNTKEDVAMRIRDAGAARLESDYLDRVRASLGSRSRGSEVEEVIQSLREHIEEELAKDPAGEVGSVRMANVLEALGAPEAYGQEEGTAPPAPAGGPRLSRLALASALCLPGAALVGLLAGLLAHWISGEQGYHAPTFATGWISATAVLLTGSVLGISALQVIRREPERLTGKGLAWFGTLVFPVLFAAAIMEWVWPDGKGTPSPYPSPPRASATPGPGSDDPAESIGVEESRSKRAQAPLECPPGWPRHASSSRADGWSTRPTAWTRPPMS